jgi:hypothetical protein
MITRQRSIDWILGTLREAAWAPLSIFVSYLLALALHLFNLYSPLDIPFHFLGGAVITYFYRAAIRHSQNVIGEIPLPIQILLAFTCTGTTTILWEFYENILDFFAGTHMVRGLQDTMMDLFFGLLGALVFSLFYRRKP